MPYTSPSASSPDPDPDPEDINFNGRTDGSNTIASTDYAETCKKILELAAEVHRLSQGGALELKLNLPRIVVIGDQSSGKSSLVEAVSGINVPRDSGTCTKCPMECSMRSAAGSWSCNISIRYSFDKDGRRLSNVNTVPFGPMITDKSEVELWIRRAQAAVLSPHRSFQTFLEKSEDELRNNAIADSAMLPFSKNVVCVEVKDPDATDLDFVDLPGIIHVGDNREVALVQDMIVRSIAGDNTLILVAISMSSDIEVQKAVSLAREADPNGDRTIGILTKPDTLTAGGTGNQERWRKILSNEDTKHLLKHGYYCVRLPDDNDRARKITRVEAQKMASDLFDLTTPWSQMIDRTRFGVPNVVKDVSALLVLLIARHLPLLRANVNRLLEECLDEIDRLPPLSDKNPSTEILLRVSKFCTDLHAAAHGKEHKHFVQKNKERYSKFMTDIKMTAPNFHLDNCERTNEFPPSHTALLRLEGVRAIKEGTITWELPNHVPFDATKVLVLRCTALWKAPTMACFKDVVKKSIKLVDDLLEEHFGQYHELMALVVSFITEERERRQKETQIMLEKLLRFESTPVYTQCHEFLQSERVKWYSVYSLYIDSSSWVDELRLMADVQAYFQVAHRRIIDYVPLAIEHEFNQSFAENLQSVLYDSILKEGNTAGRFKELLREDPFVAMERRNLEDRKFRLLSIKERLDEFRLDEGLLPFSSPYKSSPAPSTQSLHSEGEPMGLGDFSSPFPRPLSTPPIAAPVASHPVLDW